MKRNTFFLIDWTKTLQVFPVALEKKLKLHLSSKILIWVDLAPADRAL